MGVLTMSLRRDSFLRCYLEAWVYWIGLNAVGGVAFWFAGKWTELSGYPTPFSHLARMADPTLLIAQAIITIPLFAAILVGSRRSTGRND
jgi:hypothetical protein